MNHLHGNKIYFDLSSARAWLLLLMAAETAKGEDEIILAVSELLKLGWPVERGVFQRCQEDVNRKSVTPQDALYFYISLAWSKYHSEEFKKCWEILDTKVMRSSLFNPSNLSKSLMLLQAEANLIRSLLAVLPFELSPVVSSGENAPVQLASKAALGMFGSFKAYCISAQQNGWAFYGQEWHVLWLLVTGSISLSRLYMYSASPREARFFLKEALNASQKHVSILR